ncbi:MAG: TonB-dependent receptor [Paludibacter sp.]|nr:TonB-dependent receptor [Paludibacter sp.]
MNKKSQRRCKSFNLHLNKLFISLISTVIFMIIGTLSVSAASHPVKGTVFDEKTNTPLIGVSVIVEGTTTGSVTDSEGKFSLEVLSPNSTLIFSYIGYNKQKIKLNGQTNLNVVLSEETKNLDEVVVVGYGTQSRKLVTGAITSVNAKDIANIPNDGRPEMALQGRTTGVTIAANSGQPGSAMTVRIRGITSFGAGNDPLWVVDGIIVPVSNLNFLNQSDIQSIEVLKDAASAAIYGTKAATGVILVTTKKGAEGKIKVSYNGFYGTSAPTKLVNLCNATQYATLMNERSLAGGGGVIYANPASLGEGTNWQNEIFSNNASRMNHEVSVSGGNENSDIYLSIGYQNQQGIVMPAISTYEKYSMRLNHNEKFWNIFKFGQSIAYSRNQNKSIGVNTEFGGALTDAINLDPTTPVVVPTGQVLGAQYSSPYILRNTNGQAYGISNMVGQEIVNPVAWEQTQLGNNGYSDNFIANSYLEVDPIDGLKIRSQIGINRNYWGSQSFSPLYYLNSNSQNTQHNSLYRGNGQALTWNFDNTIAYTKSIDKQTFGILGGFSVYEDGIGNFTNITYNNVPVSNYQDANFNWPNVAANEIGNTSDYINHRIVSFFGRLNYNYDEKYLLTAILRADGSSRFGANNKYGYFPSVSVGWVPSQEKFWKDNINSDNISFLKIRGGYGVTGNDNFGDFQYLATLSGGNNYVIGSSGVPVIGISPTTLDNPNLKWERTTQTGVGFDVNFLRDFNFSFDYFYKKTTGLLQQVPVPQYAGVPNQPWANVGDMVNNGIELHLGYTKTVGLWKFGASANFSTLHNEVTYIGTGTPYLIQDAASFQTMGNVSRTEVGYPVNSFWGYQKSGIFQTAADVTKYVNAQGVELLPNAKPGDFRWTDTNKDGKITADDQTYLGSPIPTFNYGLTLNAEWGKASTGRIDFMIFFQGQGGNMIFQGYRRLDIQNANYPISALNRWTGGGTSNTYPRLTTQDTNNNFSNMSDFYLQKGDYLRVKNVQIGYTLPTSISNSIKSDKIRIYLSAENLATITGYDGYDPEIGGGVFGIDKGYYPQARTYMVGLNLNF